MRGRLRVTASTLLIGAALAVPAAAQDGAPVAIGPHGGFDFDGEEVFLGANAWIPLSESIGDGFLVVIPEFSWYPFLGFDFGGFEFDESVIVVAGNLAAVFPGSSSVEPYALAGLAIVRASVSGPFDMGPVTGVSEGSNTDLKLQIGAGVNFATAAANHAFVQVSSLLGSGSTLSVSGGYRFVL